MTDALAINLDAPCWLWQGGTSSKGYGWLGHLRVYAHRYMWTVMRGPIPKVPKRMELDHLCRNPRCVNPQHLEVVTHQENMRRGHFGQKTHCPLGHPYDEANTYYVPSTGYRRCRACQKRWAGKQNEERKQARRAARR